MNRTCFVTAPPDYDYIPIQKILKKYSVEVVTPFDEDLRGMSVAERITEAIEKADMFIAVIPSDLQSPNVFFELGIAASGRKPIMLISKTPSVLPIELSSLFTIQASERDTEALEFSISQFVNQSKKRRQSSKSKKPKRNTLGSSSRKYADIFTQKPLLDSELQNYVAKLLADVGAEAVSHEGIKDVRADMAFWLDEVEDIVGNPILVEIKERINNTNLGTRVAYQVEDYLHFASAKLALILYVEGIESDALQLAVRSNRVLFFKLSDLVTSLESRTLGEIIRQRRNLIAHGGYLHG